MRQLSFPSFLMRRKDAPAAVRTRKTDKRRRARRWVSWNIKPVLAALCLVVAVSSVTLAWRGGAAEALGNALLAWSGSAGVAVNDVLVTGRVETSADDVLAALDVKKGTPLFAFSPNAARDRLVALGWVRDARVERRLPDLIHVELEERTPAAIWQNGGALQLVDETGAVIGSDAVARYRGLRIIVGSDAPETFAQLFTALETRPELMPHVAAAVRIGQRRWNLKLDNGMDVLLPEEGVAAAWKVLADAVRNDALLERDLVHIDLRIPGRLVVRLSPEAARTRVAGRGA